MKRTRWSIAASLAAACWLLSVGCERGEPVQPELDPAESTDPTLAEIAAPIDFSDSYSIPVPPDNSTNQGYVAWHSTGIVVPTETYIRVRVEGGITLAPNPAYASAYCADPTCFPLAGQTIGPLGTSYYQLRVFIRVRSGGYINYYTLYPVEGDPYAAQAIIFVAAGSIVEVERRGVYGGIGLPTGFIGAYLLSGTQALSVRAIEPLRIDAQPPRVAPGDTVTFTAVPDGVLGSYVDWRFLPGDTLEVPSGNVAAGARIWACRNHPTCAFAPPADGRMYVGAPVDGLFVTGSGPVIRLGAADSLVIRMTLDRTEVLPVLARSFDAVNQTVDDYVEPQLAQRQDTVRLVVEATWQPSGRPASGAEIVLAAEPEPGSGGHAHSAPYRPGGAFLDPSGSGAWRDSASLTLPDSGRIAVLYRSSGIAGRESILAAVSDQGHADTTSAAVAVRWPGLVALARTGTHHALVDLGAESTDQRHAGVNHHVAPAMQAALLALFETYAGHFPGSAPFEITGASLEWGGMLDAGAVPWRALGGQHRTGEDVDVRSATIPPGRRTFFAQLCEDHDVVCDAESGHVHVRMATNQGRAP